MVKRKIVNLVDGSIAEDTVDREMAYYLFSYMRSNVKLGFGLFRKKGANQYEYFNWKVRATYTVLPKN